MKHTIGGVLFSNGEEVTSVPGGNVFKAYNSRGEILSCFLVSSSLSTSFILFYVAYQRDL